MNDLSVTDTGIPVGVALRDPETILKEAQERAFALTKMVEQTKSFTQIGPSKHLRVEAWITIGQFYGCSARVTDTQEISIGGVTGFKAHAKVTHDASGQILTEADSLCMQDEDNWSDKPLFQLMSMAQTRAISKALAAKFRWVVVLGGYSSTPAEEMTGAEQYTKSKASVTKASKAKKFPYGKHKGVGIDDASVTIEDLDYWISSMTAAVADPKKKQFEKSNREFLEALQAEKGRREGSGMSDDAWKDACTLWQTSHEEIYAEVCIQMGLDDAMSLEPSRRAEFHDKIRSLMK